MAEAQKPLATKAYKRRCASCTWEGWSGLQQQWVVHKGLKVCIVFEGATGLEGGTIEAITSGSAPGSFRVVALPAPRSGRKASSAPSATSHLPAAGRSSSSIAAGYNRARVERIMGFAARRRGKFPSWHPMVEKALVDSGIILLKYWLEVTPTRQERRLRDRIDVAWNLEALPMDIKSLRSLG